MTIKDFCTFGGVLTVIGGLVFSQLGCGKAALNKFDASQAEHSEQVEDDSELEQILPDFLGANCIRATSLQVSVINQGNSKLTKFMNQCYAGTGNSKWCQQVARPNPQMHSIFDCTYSISQAHYFVDPDESTWKYAIVAVNLVQELQKMGINVSTIYNWWRPEPYNKNVGGAAGRHPYGTSVDVRFATKGDQAIAHKQLCKWRRQGRLRALGYYSGTDLHFGIGDKVANTWGKSCP